ncbi:MAG TPA: YggS family pyridoxal phosphate-dependent enzyme [Phycisphaerales bacterium]|nr:YggS family pyridoxal phosphate-dependent enzyme [Phycisphaerales bacterium]
MSPPDTLSASYAEVRARIAEAAARAGRSAGDILLVAVTKYAEPDQVRELVQLGHADFGESRVTQLLQRAALIEEWLARQRVMPGAALARGSAPSGGAARPTIRWHMIGHLQRNKVKKALEAVRLVHSVDSLRLAEEIQTAAARREAPVDVLLQVNASGERSKFGCAIPAALHLAEQIDTMVQVRLRGLMTMAPLSDNPEHARATFARCREVFEEIREAGIAAGHFDILSMGMSNDFQVAIEEGANLVRVGTAIFGEPRDGAGHDDEDDPEQD